MISNGVDKAPPSKFEEAVKASQEIKGLISLSIGEPDFDTPRHIARAGIDAIERGWTHYTSNFGIRELREEIAKKMKKENKIDTNPKEVIITTGASMAIDLAMRLLLNPGDEVIVQDPGYFNYIYESYFIGAKLVSVKVKEENDFVLMADDLEDKMTDKTKLLVINSPANPTGAVIKEKELGKIADKCMGKEIFIISDEIYEKMIYDEKHFSIASLPEMKEKTITINGFSKAYAMTGWRIGYAVGDKKLIEKMRTMQMYINICPPSMSQWAALAALQESQKCVEEMLEEYKKRREYLLKRLGEMGIPCVKPAGAFYAFPNISSFGSSEEVWKFFMNEARVSTTPGNTFGENGEGYLRISYANSLKNIEKAMNQIEKALEVKK